MDDRYAAYLGGFWLDIQDIEDGFEKAMVEHAVPYAQAPILEDMGMRGRTVRFRCYFLNESYEQHREFIAFIRENRDVIQLRHPRYGLVPGKVTSVNVRHDDRLRTAEVDVTFKEALVETAPARFGDIGGASEEAFEQGVAEQEEELAADIREALGRDAADIAERELDPDKGILEQFSDIAGRAREFVKTVDAAVTKIEATLNDIANPANSLIATVEFATDLPGRVVGAVTRTAERYALLYQSVKGAPARFMQGLRTSLDELMDTLALDEGVAGGGRIRQARDDANAALRKQLVIGGARMGALQLGYIYASDEADRDAVRSAEATGQFDIQGRRTGSAPPEIVSVQEIEQSLALARQWIQDALEESRLVPSMKKQAADLLRHVIEIKLELERIVPVEVMASMPLHLVCLRYGLPYTMAPRLLGINPGVRRANFISGRVDVYDR